MKSSKIEQEKLALTRRELQEIAVLTSKLTTQLGFILTNKNDHLFSSFGIYPWYFKMQSQQDKLRQDAQHKIEV